MKLRKVIVGIFAAYQIIGAAAVAIAASDTLATKPLFLGIRANPNVYFITDDSASMDAISNWEEMEAKGEGYKKGGGNDKVEKGKGIDGKKQSEEKSENVSWDLDWRERSFSSNPQAYNPAVSYKPWPGQDSSGKPLYTSVSKEELNKIPEFLLNTNNTSTIDVTTTEQVRNLDSKKIDTYYVARYYLRSGSPPADGIVRYADPHVLVEIKPISAIYSKSTLRSDCITIPNACTYEEEIINFANWYKYHRRRAHIAINATGYFINDASDINLSLRSINRSKDKISLLDVDSSSNKAILLERLYSPLTLKGGTPLKTALDTVGQHLAGASSPILPASEGGACQQNFAIMMTDGYWTDNKPDIGNIDAGQPLPYGDKWSNTLADFAMKYYATDLRSDLDNLVPVIPNVDEANWQHLVTHTIGLGTLSTVDPATTDPSAPGFAWKDPDKLDVAKGDDLWHAAINGRGRYYHVRYPDQLTRSMSEILNTIGAQDISSSLALNSYTTLNDSNVVYQSTFDSRKWHGDLLAYKFDTATSQPVLPALWSAAAELKNETPQNRSIFTYSSAVKKGVPFRWENISIAHKNDLNTGPDGPDDKGKERLDFLRGDRSNEGNIFRSRDNVSIIGDIIHSDPVYVGAPSFQYLDVGPGLPAGDQAYSSYKLANANRQGTVYVGANDGMLHGFSASSGKEVLAYIPSSVLSVKKDRGLHYLTDTAYQHRYYVDASPSIWDAYINYRGSDGSVVTTPDWRTILIGSLGAGGRGIFALDITNPTDFKESNAAKLAMWEFSKADNPNLGFTLSKPIVTLLKTGASEYRWAAILGNGYDDNSDPTTAGQARLFILFLDGGLDGVWTPGSDYIEINTQAGSTSNRNGLSSPSIIDTNGDGLADRVYAGDLLGNMWAFDTSSASPNEWKVAYQNNGQPAPLFTAIKDSKPQPITSAPNVVRYPILSKTDAAPNVLVLFGTGQYLTEQDIGSTAVQTFYGIWDKGQPVDSSRATLLEQTISTDISNPDTRTISDSTMSSTQTGWYLDLSAGERVVASPAVIGEQVYFGSMVPQATPCSSGGTGWLTNVNLENGGAKQLVMENADQVSVTIPPGESKKIEGGLPNSITAVKGSLIVSTTGGDTTSYTTGQPSSYKGTGRQSWREIRR